MNDIKNRIKLIRKSQNLSQDEFGKAINLSRSQIAGYETGAKNIAARSIKDICREFCINEEWLKTGNGDMYAHLASDERFAFSTEHLSERIKEIRKAEHLTQTKFGEKLGVTRDIISNFESCRVEPKPLFINHISTSFNINKEWLVNGTGDMYNSNNAIVHLKLKEAIYKNIIEMNNIESLNNIKSLSDLLLSFED